MNTPKMILSSWFKLSAFVSVLSFASLAGVAQSSPKENSFSAGVSTSQVIIDRQINDLVFDELPLSSIVEFLRSEYDGINFILADEVADVTPSLQLRRVSLLDILEALSLATNQLVQFEQVSERLFHLFVNPGLQQQTQLKAFSLRSYFSDFDGDDDEALKELYQTLDQGWSMMRNGASRGHQNHRPEISIHQKTKLLIVVGYPSELGVVESIVDALQAGRSTVRFGGGGGAAGGGFGSAGDVYGYSGRGGGGAGMEGGYGGGLGAGGAQVPGAGAPVNKKKERR